MLPKQNRLLTRASFQAVNSRGAKYVGRFLIVRSLSKPGQTARFGFSVSTRVGKSVVRNRVRRRLREAVRKTGMHLERDFDVVIIARDCSAEASWDDLLQEVSQALSKLTRQPEGKAPTRPGGQATRPKRRSG